MSDRWVTCPHCEGTQQEPLFEHEPCHYCLGDGYVAREDAWAYLDSDNLKERYSSG